MIRLPVLLTIFLLTIRLFVFAQQGAMPQLIQGDTTLQSHAPPALADENDFSPGLFVGVLLMSVAALILVGVGVVFTFIFLLLFFILVSLGIISASVAAGIKKKSVTHGFKVFVVAAVAFLSTCLSVPAFVLINAVVHWSSWPVALILGIGSGITGGIALGYAVYFIVKWWIAVYFKRLLLTRML